MKLKGTFHSGIIFIGDPVFMSADPQKEVDGIITPDPLNPFKNWDGYLADGTDDRILKQGVAVQTHRFQGAYELEKEFNEDGTLKAVRIVFK